MADNAALIAHMVELDMTQVELVKRLNKALEIVTGREGDVSMRTAWNLVDGRTRRPIGRICAALELVFNCPVTELGFSQPRNGLPPQEDPVLRRVFLNSATAVAGGLTAPALTAPTRIGVSDVRRLQERLHGLVLLDDRVGGHAALEEAAQHGAREALKLQHLNATQRVRQRLYGVAANYTVYAAWSCFDAGAYDRAQTHLAQAGRLAGMAQDPYTQLQTWNVLSMVTHRQNRHPDAIAAALAAQRLSTHRRDAFLASLAHARTAIAHIGGKDTQAALRSLGRAEEALTKADPAQPRPSWTDFYGVGELMALSSTVYLKADRPARAEAAAHQALAHQPHRFRRNRALVTARLAISQLTQGDVEHSYTTASKTLSIMGDGPPPQRLRTSLNAYGRELQRAAPGSREVGAWSDRMATKWS
ncbi:XRE family transcriptional regulator [Streptomyces sp. NPDC058171]